MTRRGADPAELTLRYEAGRWRATGAGVDVVHFDLSTLDRLIADAIGRNRANPPRRAHVRFDVDRLPKWMRQYQAHYFNYVLTLDGGV